MQFEVNEFLLLVPQNVPIYTPISIAQMYQYPYKFTNNLMSVVPLFAFSFLWYLLRLRGFSFLLLDLQFPFQRSVFNLICVISYWWFYLFLTDYKSSYKFGIPICYLFICCSSFNLQVSSYCCVKTLNFYEVKSVNVCFQQFLSFCVLIKASLFKDIRIFLFSFNNVNILFVYTEDFDLSRMYFE